ncbi:hypothetical protein WDW89_03460 [Deltaproteobacteria bacterium TL4]
MKQLIQQIKKHFSKARPEYQKGSADLKQMQWKYEEISIRWQNEQARYHQLCKKREQLWHRMEQIHADFSLFQRLKGRSKHPEYQQCLRQYLEVETLIETEIKHLKTLDDLYYTEIKSQTTFQEYWHLLPVDFRL